MELAELLNDNPSFKKSFTAQSKNMSTYIKKKDFFSLFSQDEYCEDIMKEKWMIKKKKLGEGVYASTFIVNLKGFGEKEFALKTTENIIEKKKLVIPEQLKNKRFVRLKDFVKLVEKYNGMPSSVFLTINQIYNDKINLETINGKLVTQKTFLLFKKNISCTKEKLSYKDVHTGEEIKLPKGSKLCSSHDKIADIYFGRLCSELYTSGTCINFIPLLAYSSCFNDKKLRKIIDDASVEDLITALEIVEFDSFDVKDTEKTEFTKEEKQMLRKKTKKQLFYKILEYNAGQIGWMANFHPNQSEFTSFLPLSVVNYILMEKADTTLGRALAKKCFEFKSKNYKLLHCLYIQLLFAIATMQKKYKMVHGDLHPNNILIKLVKPGDMYNGKELHSSRFFHYQIGNTHYYLRELPFIVKIADFSISRSFGNDGYIMHEYLTRIEPGSDTGRFPNWYSQSYDVLHSFNNIFRHVLSNLFQTHNFYSFGRDHVTAKLFSEIYSVDSKLKHFDLQKEIKSKVDGIFNNYDNRPFHEYTKEKDAIGLTPESLLKNKSIFGDYILPYKNFQGRETKELTVTLGKI